MPTVGGNLGNQHYSALTQINKSNLKQLGPVWRTHVSAVAPATDDVGQQTTPIVVDGVIYLDTPNGGVIAVDGATGATKWKWDADGVRHDRHAARRLGRGRQGLHARRRQPRRRPRQGHRRGGLGRAAHGPRTARTLGRVDKVATVYHDGMVYVHTNDGDRGAVVRA